MKINYAINDKNKILNYTIYPFDENDPWIEIEDPSIIHIGYDEVVNGKLIQFDQEYQTDLNNYKLLLEKENRISELKKLLTSSDYKVMKYLEGLITAEEYSPIKSQRQLWRDEINQIESEIKLLK